MSTEPPTDETSASLPDTKIWRSPLRAQIDQMLLQNKREGKPLYKEIIAWAGEHGLKLNSTDLSRHYKKYLEKEYTLALLEDAGRFNQEIIAANVSHESVLRSAIYKGILAGLKKLKAGTMKIGGRELAALLGRGIQLLDLEVRFYERNPDQYVASVMGEVLFDEPDVLQKALKRLRVRAEKQKENREKTLREMWEEAGRVDEGDA
jgi:DNA-binding transcriptional ArsR family regulator